MHTRTVRDRGICAGSEISIRHDISWAASVNVAHATHRNTCCTAVVGTRSVVMRTWWIRGNKFCLQEVMLMRKQYKSLVFALACVLSASLARERRAAMWSAMKSASAGP